MNSFGTLFRVQIFGESHGHGVGVIIDGCPPGVPLNVQDFTTDLDRRKGGQRAGTTPRAETDAPNILSGIYNDHTTGAPMLISFTNDNTRSRDYEQLKESFRPGHADFTANVKFKGFEDFRGGGHFSGRLTVALVAAGVVAKKILNHLNDEIKISAEVIQVAGKEDIELGIQHAIDINDSVGGLVNCTIKNLPVGLGDPFFDSVESLISHAVFSIPAVKGISFGSGFKAATMVGSEHNDSLEDAAGRTTTNHAGGIAGGLTNGNEINFQIVVKPASSTPQPQETYNRKSEKKEILEVKGRHDLVIALRVPPVLEAVAAFVVADLMLRSLSVK